MDNIFSQEFSLGDVALASGASPQTIKSWLHKGVVIGHRKITGGGGAGKRRKYTFFNIMEIATAKAILDVATPSLGIEIAFKAAQVFAHVGGADNLVLDRCPSVPFDTAEIKHRKTLLCLSGNHARVICYDVGSDIIPSIRTSLMQPEGMIIMEMNDIFDRVTDSLGYRAEDVFLSAYPTTQKSKA